jgi:V8-like Glu-specific endopeptidase
MICCTFLAEILRVDQLHFHGEHHNIIKAANCTSFVHIEESGGRGRPARVFYGTAFFVSSQLLLTAGHNIAGINGSLCEIRITRPGTRKVRPLQVVQRKLFTIACKVVGTIYKRDGAVSGDLAILETDSFKASTFLPLFTLAPPPKATVSIIGYPAEIKYEWIKAHKSLRHVESGKADAERLFPLGNLTVSQGAVETVGSTITYHMSTCPGMSGSCVLYKGCVIGEYDCYHG